MKDLLAWMLLLPAIGCNGEKVDTSEIEPAEPSVVQSAPADPIRILAWNIESGGNSPDVIAQQLTEMPDYDVYALSEVSPKNLHRYSAIFAPSYKSIESRSGGADRLQFLFDSERLELVRSEELIEQAVRRGSVVLHG